MTIQKGKKISCRK